MTSVGAAPRAAVPVSNARAAASRRNGAKSRGPKTAEGKARAARNALQHGLRAEKCLVLPEEDAAEFAGLEAALVAELAPVGALQTVLARRIVVAAWRLARADRIEAELFEEQRYQDGGLGLCLIRDGNGTRSFETLLRYRGAAMAEFWRALKTLKALQAEQAAATGPALAAHPLDVHPKAQSSRPAARPRLPRHPQPNEPERAAGPRLQYGATEPPARARTLHEPAAHALEPNEPKRASEARLAYVMPEPPAPGLHEPAAPWRPNEPGPGLAQPGASTPGCCVTPEPQPTSTRPEGDASCPHPRLAADRANPSQAGITAGSKLAGADRGIRPPR